jgi:hypothetical protein
VGRGSRTTAGFREGVRISLDAEAAVPESSPSRAERVPSLEEPSFYLRLAVNQVRIGGQRWDRLGGRFDVAPASVSVRSTLRENPSAMREPRPTIGGLHRPSYVSPCHCEELAYGCSIL